mgnify:CR=1 FL=1
MYFKDIHIGRHFICNGNLCLKKSTMTAEIVAYKKTYYYEKLEVVKEVRGAIKCHDTTTLKDMYDQK